LVGKALTHLILLFPLPKLRGEILNPTASRSFVSGLRCNVGVTLVYDFTGKTALVTGAASGIGLAVVEILAHAGACVALNYLDNDIRGLRQLERLRVAGLKVIGAPGNVAEPASAERMVSTAISELGRLDFLINNAGTPATREPIPPRDLDRLTEDIWETIISTNLVGPYRCTKFAAAELRAAKGAVVNTASIAGLGIVGSSIAYGASKAGLVNMTQNLARALAPEARVNAVAPGYVESDWTREWPVDKKTAFVEKTLLKRPCTPGDIAEVIVFLCGGGSMVTGQTLVVDGGLSLA